MSGAGHSLRGCEALLHADRRLDSAMPSLAPATGNNSSSASTTAAGGGRTALPPLLQQLLVLPAGRSLGDGSKSALAEKHLKVRGTQLGVQRDYKVAHVQ
jgi:hypothetical protein